MLKIDRKSRAEYFRERRKDRKDFNVLIPKEKYEAIDKKLKEQNRTKTEWLIEKIDEEIKKYDNVSIAKFSHYPTNKKLSSYKYIVSHKDFSFK